MVPLAALEMEPRPLQPAPTSEELAEALDIVLDAVELGAYDRRILGWAVRFLDAPTIRTFASLIGRARIAERTALEDRIIAAALELTGHPSPDSDEPAAIVASGPSVAKRASAYGAVLRLHGWLGEQLDGDVDGQILAGEVLRRLAAIAGIRDDPEIKR